MQPAAFRFQAFLCYSHRDSAWADWLHRALESYPIPSRLVGLTTSAGVIPARLAPVFRDRDELPSATDLSGKVTDALAQSACLVVICSPHSAQSHWVNEEVEAFQRLGRANRIFCLIVDGEPGASAWAGREHDECLPAALMHRIDASGNPTAEILEPIAADVRPGKDGRSNARTKLVAGILGVDLDDLRHRERRRHRWRLAAALAAGFAVLCVTTGLAVNAVIARHAAERRQKQAEDLIGFMLGDLDDKLRQVNRLDILETVDDRIARYFADLPTSDITNDTLAQRARAMLKIGSVRRDQGRIAEALEAFNLAFASTRQLIARVPNSVEYQTIHAESLNWLGFVDWSQGRLDDAVTRFSTARDLLERLHDVAADDNDVLDHLGVARSNLGRIFEARGHLDKARVEYAAVMEIYSSLGRRQPEKLEWKAELGYAHKNLGRLALAEGKLEESAREIIADRRIKASLLVVDAGNSERREDLAASNASLGWILYLCGNVRLAEDYLGQAVEQTVQLLSIDPDSTDWLAEGGRYGWMWATTARARGDLSEAARRSEDAVKRLNRLVAKDPDNVDWQREWMRAEIERARCLLSQGHIDAARGIVDSLRQALAHLGDDRDRANALLAAQVQLAHGDVAAAGGESAEARSAWSAAREFASAQADGSSDPAVLDALGSAQLRLGDFAAAQPNMEVLARAGYQQPDFVATLARAGVRYEPGDDVAKKIADILDDVVVTQTP